MTQPTRNCFRLGLYQCKQRKIHFPNYTHPLLPVPPHTVLSGVSGVGVGVVSGIAIVVEGVASGIALVLEGMVVDGDGGSSTLRLDKLTEIHHRLHVCTQLLPLICLMALFNL